MDSSDANALQARLCHLVEREIAEASAVQIRSLRPLAGGNARRAWSFDLSYRGVAATHALGCVLLIRSEAGQLEREVGPEFRALAALEGSGVPAPRALCCDESGAVLGNPGFVMERVAGSARLGPLLDPAERERNRALALSMAEAAAALHRVDWRARGLGADAHTQGGETDHGTAAGAAGRQLDEWERLFVAHRMEPLPALSHAFRWLRDNAPSTDQVSLVHGDFRFGNILYEGPVLRAVLDWEMTHLGDPCEDLAWAYRTLWSPRACLNLDEFLAHYERAGGPHPRPESLRFYRLFGELKHAVISLTGARAFADGRTHNLRLADRMSWVPECLERFYAACATAGTGD